MMRIMDVLLDLHCERLGLYGCNTVIYDIIRNQNILENENI